MPRPKKKPKLPDMDERDRQRLYQVHDALCIMRETLEAERDSYERDRGKLLSVQMQNKELLKQVARLREVVQLLERQQEDEVVRDRDKWARYAIECNAEFLARAEMGLRKQNSKK